MNNIFVYIEIEDGAIADVSLELLTKGRELASKLGVKLEAVVLGYNLSGIEKELSAYGAKTVWVADDAVFAPYSTLPYAAVVSGLVKAEQPQIVLFGATSVGRDFAPRVSATLKTGLRGWARLTAGGLGRVASIDAGAEYQNSLIFVGDSLTAHLRSHGVLKGGKDTKQVWTCENNTMTLSSEINAVKIVYPETGEKMTISEAAAKAKPAILVINLGINGFAFLNEAEFKAHYTALIKAIQEASPDTGIILQSIYPVTDFCTTFEKSLDGQPPNPKIDQTNTWVKAVAAENGCRYLDTQSILKDEKNNLKTEYCNNPDGIHMGKNAYVQILEYVRTHAYTD
jgi:hypothetical protein